MPSDTRSEKLHQAIMNLPLLDAFDDEGKPDGYEDGYIMGHRDARHAAAELVQEFASRLAPAPQPVQGEGMDLPDGTGVWHAGAKIITFVYRRDGRLEYARSMNGDFLSCGFVDALPRGGWHKLQPEGLRETAERFRGIIALCDDELAALRARCEAAERELALLRDMERESAKMIGDLTEKNLDLERERGRPGTRARTTQTGARQAMNINIQLGDNGFGVVCRDPNDDQARREWANEVYRIWREAGWPALVGPGAEEKKQAQAILGLDY